MPEKLKMREGWFALLILFLLLFTITLSLEAAKWASGLNILFSVFLMAFMVGVFFAKSRLSGLLMHPLALAIGTCWIGFMSLSLVKEDPWEDQLVEVVTRLLVWSRELSGGQTSSDTLPFVVLMAVLVWLISYSATWYFFREHNIWGVLLPSSMTILVNTYYASSELTFLLLIYLILAFLLVIRINLIEQEERWRQSHIFYHADMQFDFFREGAVFAVLVVGLAWLLPATVTNADLNPYMTWATEPWGRAQQEWNRVFSALNYRGSAVNGTWFSTSMNFHGPLNRSERLVMNVKSDEGRYWRAVVLDEYTSAGWAISQKRVSDQLEAHAPLNGKNQIPLGRTVTTQEYTIFDPAGILLLAAGQPLEVDLPAQILYGGPAAYSEGLPSADAVSQLYAQQSIYQGQSYTALSAIPTVDVPSLRQAGTLYPQWIKDHYTILPDSLPDRVRQLAADVASDAQTPYDTAHTIEQYLRQIPYNEKISGPNPGEDGVDYFLFREQQGYCDYYASAMAVMLRSLGIPTRLAQGYSQGQLLESGEYEVRQTNAHTWVEVYFPGYGWIEFEPTAAEAAIERPTAPVGASATPLPDPESNEPDQLEEDEPFERQQNEIAQPIAPEPDNNGLLFFDPRILLIPLGLFGVFGLVALVGWVAIQRRWRFLTPVERLYDQLSLMGRVLGQRIDPRLTPSEYAERVSQKVPLVRKPLARLAALFSKQRFSGSSLEEEELIEAQASWSKARRPLLHGVFERFTKRK